MLQRVLDSDWHSAYRRMVSPMANRSLRATTTRKTLGAKSKWRFAGHTNPAQQKLVMMDRGQLSGDVHRSHNMSDPTLDPDKYNITRIPPRQIHEGTNHQDSPPPNYRMYAERPAGAPRPALRGILGGYHLRAQCTTYTRDRSDPWISSRPSPLLEYEHSRHNTNDRNEFDTQLQGSEEFQF